MSNRCLSRQELAAIEQWAETLGKPFKESVLALIQEARDHRKLLAQLHDDFINEMS